MEVSVDDDAVARGGRRRCVEEDDGSRAQLISPPPLSLSLSLTPLRVLVSRFGILIWYYQLRTGSSIWN